MTPRLAGLIRRMFVPEDAETVIDVLACLDLPFVEGPPSERVQTAIVLFADGDLDRLGDGIDLAEEDWRDILVAAGLAKKNWRHVLDDVLGSSSR